jgi:hypothetical protein
LADLATNKNETEWEVPSIHSPCEVTYIEMMAKSMGMVVEEAKGIFVVRKPRGYKLPSEEKIKEVLDKELRGNSGV